MVAVFCLSSFGIQMSIPVRGEDQIGGIINTAVQIPDGRMLYSRAEGSHLFSRRLDVPGQLRHQAAPCRVGLVGMTEPTSTSDVDGRFRLPNLPAGNYTAIVRGVNSTTGVALVEVYDLGP